MVLPVAFDDIERAAALLEGQIERTPATVSRTLSDIIGATVVLKFENLQFTGSFKDRGAGVKLGSLTTAERANGVLAISAGNHAQGVAYHAGRLGIASTIVMPTTAPLTKIANTRQLGAEVVLAGVSLADAAIKGQELIAERDLTLVHPYDDPLIVAGQGTAGLELLADHPDLDVIVVPIGGGGLAAGIAVVADAVAPSCRILGVQTESHASMVNALAGSVADIRGGTTIADGIAVKTPGGITREILSTTGAEVISVSEERIEEALGLLVEVEKTVAEGAGAAGLAALLDRPDDFAGQKVGVVISGGNIDPRLLSSVILRSLVRQGRMTRLRVEADDLPGNLGRVATIVGEEGGNLIEVDHARLESALPARRVDLDLLVETLDRAHLERIVEALADAGFASELLPS